jgi:hypothetical protein
LGWQVYRCHGRRSAAASPSRKHGVQWGVQHVPAVGPADDAASRRRERRCRRDEEAVKILNTRVQGNRGPLARLRRCQGGDVGRKSRKHLVVRHGRLRTRGARPRVDGCGWEGRDNGKDRHVVLGRHKVPLVLATLGVGLLRPPVVDRCCRPGHHHVFHVCFFLLRNDPKRASLDASTQSWYVYSGWSSWSWWQAGQRMVVVVGLVLVLVQDLGGKECLAVTI